MAQEPDGTRTTVAPRGVPTVASSSRARFRIASLAGRMAAAATRISRIGRPELRGQVMLRVDPDSVIRLLHRQPWVLVIGQYGTTVLAGLLLAAVRAAHGTEEPRLVQATASDGVDGLVAVLADRSAPDLAVVGARPGDAADLLAAGALPEAVVLFSTSGAAPAERYAQARRLRDALGRLPVPVIAGVDDPISVLAAGSARRQVWVRGEAGYGDQLLCPGCGSILVGVGGRGWRCPRRDYVEPEPDYLVQDGKITDAGGQVWDPRLRLPGRLGVDQACFALAAAESLEINAGTVFVGMRNLEDALGRFRTVRIGDSSARLLAARHPAEFEDALAVIDKPTVIIATDESDVGWVWDCDPAPLAGRTVITTGERAPDVAVRLSHAGLACRTVPDLAGALAGHRRGADVVATPAAFRALLRLGERP